MIRTRAVAAQQSPPRAMFLGSMLIFTVREHFADHTQGVLLALSRRNVLLDLGVEQGETDFVVVTGR